MTFLPTAKSETILFSTSTSRYEKKNALPHDFFSCWEIRNKDIFKAGLSSKETDREVMAEQFQIQFSHPQRDENGFGVTPPPLPHLITCNPRSLSNLTHQALTMH